MRELVIAALLFTSALVSKVFMDDGPIDKRITAGADAQARKGTEKASSEQRPSKISRVRGK
jgi:hypothetical protein